MANYVDSNKLYYEMLISKGKGKLTRDAEKFLILIATNVVKKKEKFYSCQEDAEDCLQTALLTLFTNWKSINLLKYDNPSSIFAYLSEISKRGMTNQFNELMNRKGYYDDLNVKFISIDRSNDGKGLHSF